MCTAYRFITEESFTLFWDSSVTHIWIQYWNIATTDPDYWFHNTSYLYDWMKTDYLTIWYRILLSKIIIGQHIRFKLLSFQLSGKCYLGTKTAILTMLKDNLFINIKIRYVFGSHEYWWKGQGFQPKKTRF